MKEALADQKNEYEFMISDQGDGLKQATDKVEKLEAELKECSEKHRAAADELEERRTELRFLN